MALESGSDDAALRSELAAAFATMRGRIAAALVRAGHPQALADGLAALIVAAYEGGLLQARVAQHTAPLVMAMDALRALLQASGHTSSRTSGPPPDKEPHDERPR